MKKFTPTTDEQIKEFIKKFCILVSDTPSEETELYMDNHKCIVYDNLQYYLPEDTFHGGRNAEIYDILVSQYIYKGDDI